MSKLYLILFVALIIPFAGIGQYAYIPEFIGTANLKYTDLSNPANYTVVGSTVANLGAMDFGPDNMLYGISGSDNGLYSIDITDGSSSLIATVTPTGSEFWTGMALDPTDGTMYICSTDGNQTSFYTLDLNTGAKTLVGTNSYESGAVGIAFDDSGQMYAIYLVRKFYSINKNDATGTLIGSLNTSPSAGQWHGLDFCSENQTMYMTAYNTFTFDNELYTIDLATAANTLVGSVVTWAGSIACEPAGISAGFTADNITVCEGDDVNFTDQSTGTIVSWDWSFEGGSPSSSTLPNPTVTYNTAGTYDVQLIVSDGSMSDTLLIGDYITVSAIPDQASTPTGPEETCEAGIYDYTTATVNGATGYDWEVDPSSAGSISGSGTTGTFTSALNWTGAYTVKVRANNDCGDGAWSSTLSCNLNHSPEQYDLTGGGPYCEGGQGVELILSSSETGVDYELYLDDVSTGTILPGTGNPLSFGYQTEQGFYTVTGFNSSCTVEMVGENYIFIQPLPGQPGTPAGEETVCNNESSEYTAEGTTNADSYTWVLDPSEAGTLTPDGLTVTVEWSQEFSGSALLSLYASNDCGDGTSSGALEINVNLAPSPQISGPVQVCSGYTENYSTEDHAGSTYSWEVTGGTIIDGSASSQVTIEWGGPGAGSLSVTETYETGCTTTTDPYAVSIEECTSIMENMQERLRISPNPVESSLTVNLPEHNSDLLISIYTISSKKLFEEELPAGNNQTSYIFDVSDLKAGLYILKVTSQEGLLITGKFIKR